MDGNRDLRVDLLRGAAIIGVLFIHSSFSWSPRASLLIEIAARMSRPAVAVFFFCSGYCSRISKGSGIAPQLRRCSLFLGTYLIWLLLSLFVARLICGIGLACPWGGEDLMSLRNGHMELSPVAFQLYFLLALVVIKIADALAVATGARRLCLAMSHFLIAYFIIVIFGLPTAWHGSALSNLSLYFFSFGLGRVVQIWRNPLPSALQFFALFLSIVGIAFLGERPSLVTICLASVVLLCSLGAAEAFRYFFPKLSVPLVSLGVISGGIYLLHAPFLSSLIYKIAAPLDQAGLLSMSFYFVVLLFASSFLVISLSSLLGKNISRLILLS